jgi:Resolvase, N terminal domain
LIEQACAKAAMGVLASTQMLKDASRRKFDVVMAWAIDRLGRSLIDLLGTIQTLEASGVDLYLDQQSIDTNRTIASAGATTSRLQLRSLVRQRAFQLHSSLAVAMPSAQAGTAGEGVVMPALVAAAPPLDP